MMESGHGHVGSFGEVISCVRLQIRAGDFAPTDRPQAEEIVRILAEMKMLPADASVSICGVKMPAAYVQEVYSLVEHDHVRMAIEQFRKQSHEIKFPKSYLRTALYNAVFELEGRVTNEVAQEMR